MKRLIKYCSTALLLAALALPVVAEPRPAGASRYDQQIEQQVTQQLQKHDSFKNLRAATEDGIVTLEGQVPSYLDKLKAQKAVKKVEHVQGVRNLVEVTTTVPDQELESKLADKLRYDRVGYGIMFNALGVEVKDGVVTISGKVRDYPDQASALAIVEGTPGVKDVINNIEVLPASIYDDELRFRLARAIYGSSALQRYAIDPQAPIRIVVDGGHVTLDGVVDSAMDRQIADVRARSVPGVFSVTDNLVVASHKAQGM